MLNVTTRKYGVEKANEETVVSSRLFLKVD